MTQPSRKTQVITPDNKEDLQSTLDSILNTNMPPNTALAKITLPNPSSQRPVEAEDVSEADEEIPRRGDGPSSTIPPVASPPLTDADLDRLERLIALQERAAKIQGHKYGKLTVTGNARAMQGNVFNSPEAQVLGRSHQFGDTEAKDGSLINGDIVTNNIDGIFSGKKRV